MSELEKALKLIDNLNKSERSHMINHASPTVIALHEAAEKYAKLEPLLKVITSNETNVIQGCEAIVAIKAIIEGGEDE